MARKWSRVSELVMESPPWRVCKCTVQGKPRYGLFRIGNNKGEIYLDSFEECKRKADELDEWIADYERADDVSML